MNFENGNSNIDKLFNVMMGYSVSITFFKLEGDTGDYKTNFLNIVTPFLKKKEFESFKGFEGKYIRCVCLELCDFIFDNKIDTSEIYSFFLEKVKKLPQFFNAYSPYSRTHKTDVYEI